MAKKPPEHETEDHGTDVVTTAKVDDSNPFNRRALADHVSHGAVSIESDRAVAEAQGKLIIAKRFPRDEARCYSKIMQACARKSLAEIAMYAFPRGGQTVKGPSIRLAEELARCWENMSYGTRELSRKEGISEMEAFAWDEETNVRSVQQFTVRHIRDKQGGGVALRDERDIYELTANQAARRLRARILAIIPPDIIEAAIDQCRKTLAGANDEPIVDRVRRMVTAFARFGVTPEQIERKLKHPLEETTAEDIVDLTAIYTSLKDAQSSVGDWFGFSTVAGSSTPPTRPRALESIAAQQGMDAAIAEDAPPAATGTDDGTF